MVGYIKAGFALIAAALFLLGSIAVLLSAQTTPGFRPNEGQLYLVTAIGGALISFITAQLGLASGNSEQGAGPSLRAAMGTGALGQILLGLDVLVFVAVGLWYTFLWVNPSSIAVSEGAPPLMDAPDYISTQSKLFGGAVIASIAAARS